MKPFRLSITARIVSLAIAVALFGGGAIPILGLAPSVALPILLIPTVLACIVGLILGAQEHTGAVLMLALLLPLGLWAYTLALLVVTGPLPQLAWGLVALGVVVAASTVVVAPLTTRRSAHSVGKPAAHAA
jgi:hypothetical protein